MISPEVLRRYPFFGFASEEQLRKLAMIANEETVDAGVTLLEEGKPAEALYFLLEGSVGLLYRVGDPNKPETYRELPVGHIDVGEPFGISACIEPRILTASVIVDVNSKVISINADALREFCHEDMEFAFGMINQIASVALSRLNATRVQLAAAWAPSPTE